MDACALRMMSFSIFGYPGCLSSTARHTSTHATICLALNSTNASLNPTEGSLFPTLRHAFS